MEPSVNARPSIWNGVFGTWKDAEIAAFAKSDDRVRAFDTARWIERQSAMLASARSGVSPRHTNLPLLIASTGARSIFDLGGGSGWTFEIASRNTNVQISEYVIGEQESTVDAFTSSFNHDNRLQFVVSEEISSERLSVADVLYSNSVLQYFPDNEFFVDLISMCAPKWILLDDFQTALGGEFFSTQHYYGIEIPCRFLDLQSWRDEMWRLGFTLAGKLEYPAAIGGHLEPSLGNSSGSERVIGAPCSLLFRKTSPSSGGSQYASKVRSRSSPISIEVR